jgi:hypothetical protein
MVFNLSDFVDPSFFRDVLWSWRFRLENIGLQFHFCNIRTRLSLFSQEVSEVDVYTSRRSGSQIIRRNRIFAFFEFEQLLLYHLDLFALSLFFNALLFSLSRSLVLFEHVEIVSISSEDSLVIHNVKSLSTFFLLGNGRIEHAILSPSILVMVSYDSRLSSLK